MSRRIATLMLPLIAACGPLIPTLPTGSTGGTTGSTNACAEPGSCLSFTPLVTLVQVEWNPNLGTGFPPAGAGKFRIMVSDYALTCADVDAAISPQYHTLVIAGDCGMEGSACSGNMTGPNPLQSGQTMSISVTESASPEASIGMTAPSGSYSAVSGSVSLTAVSEMSAEVSYTATLQTPGSTDSFPISGTTSSATYCMGNP